MNTIWCCVLALVGIIAFGIIVFCVMRNRTSPSPMVSVRQKGGANALDVYPLLACTYYGSPAYDIIVRTAERFTEDAINERGEDTWRNDELYRFFGENFSALAAAKWICVLNLLESMYARSSIFNDIPEAPELAQAVVEASKTPVIEMMAEYVNLHNSLGDPGDFHNPLGDYENISRLSVDVAMRISGLSPDKEVTLPHELYTYDRSEEDTLAGGGKPYKDIARANPDESDEDEWREDGTYVPVRLWLYRVLILSCDDEVIVALMDNNDFKRHILDKVTSINDEILAAYIEETVPSFSTTQSSIIDDIHKLCSALVAVLIDHEDVVGYADINKDAVINLLMNIFDVHVVHAILSAPRNNPFDPPETLQALIDETDPPMVEILNNIDILRSTNLPFIDTVEAYYRDTDIDRDAAIRKIHLVLYNLASAMVEKYEY